MPFSQEQKDEYAQAIWEAFVEKLPQERMMSAIEWALLSFWMREYVPLRLVLGVMGETKVRPNSLMYYEAAVADRRQRYRSVL